MQKKSNIKVIKYCKFTKLANCLVNWVQLKFYFKKKRLYLFLIVIDNYSIFISRFKNSKLGQDPSMVQRVRYFFMHM